MDSDVVCLKSFRFDSDYVFVKERIKRGQLDRFRKRFSFTNWFIRVPAGAEIMDRCYREAASRDSSTLTWGKTGPRLLRKAILELGMESFALPQEHLFRTGAAWWRQFVSGSFLADRRWNAEAKNACVLHLYNEMWRRAGCDKNGAFPANSIYERLKREYLDD